MKHYISVLRFFRQYSLLLLFFALQLCFWNISRHKLPDIGIVPEVPGKVTLKALSFGDEEFYFRVNALELQNAGDTFGRFTELYKYDYMKLRAWFSLMDALDNTSDYMPFLASYYYSQTQYVPDIRYVVDYLYEDGAYRPDQKYWWLAQGAYLAEHKLKDNDLALKLAAPLEHAEHAPMWVRQLPAFVHEKRGEMQDAFEIIEHIKQNAKDISPGELHFMTYFVKERLHHLETEQPKEP